MRSVDGHHHETHLKYVMWHRETIWKQMVSQDCHNYSAPKYSSDVNHYRQATMTAKWSLVLPQYRYIDYTRMCELHNNNDQLYQPF